MTLTSISEAVENFALFDDWEGRYRYLIDLGRELPHMAEQQKTDERLVRGCTSRVWLISKTENGIFNFNADSDAHIVRGLIALLVVAYDGKPVAEIPTVDIDTMFHQIGLDQHLSPNRRSGFFAMVERIKQLSALQPAA
jgi:cysteine desulfuration protein SufE